MSWSEGSSLFFLGVRTEKGKFFQVVFWCGEWDCPLFTFHLDSGQWTLSVNVFLWGGAGVKGKSSQVPEMFLKEFPIARHIYPIPYALANVVLISPT